ncbi:MAG: PBP1A family penicillin-binding protein [Pseudomonadota bacterium]
MFRIFKKSERSSPDDEQDSDVPLEASNDDTKPAEISPDDAAEPLHNDEKYISIKNIASSNAPQKIIKNKLKLALTCTYWLSVFAVWSLIIMIGAITYYAVTLPDPVTLAIKNRPGHIKFLSKDDNVIAVRGLQREHIALNNLPQHLINAVLSIEDSRFYDHIGFDPLGIVRASVVNYQYGKVVQGGSTISQQLAKNLYFTSERTFARKVKEMVAAFWLEVRLEKDKILEIYFNSVYFGAGAYGVEAASQRYFAKPASQVLLYESALLAGLLKAPSLFAPTYDLKTSHERAYLVLERMQALGAITTDQMQEALEAPVDIIAHRGNANINYVLDWMMEDLPKLAGVRHGDIIVHTTLDANLQKLTSATVRQFMDRNGKRARAGQAAAVMLDKTGAIRALVGGRSYRKSQFNRAIKAKRQPGSAFKPFVYLAALQTGLTPNSIVRDTPVNIKGWRPRNYAGYYRGNIPMHHALRKSINTVAVRMFQRAGHSRVIQTAKRLGIRSPMHTKPSLALGTSETSLLELTSAYVPFANGGFSMRPYAIKKITDANGKVLYKRAKHRPTRVMASRHVRYMNTMLRSVVLKGTGRRAHFKGQILAGKTGTSQNFRDAWFLGYSPYYTLGIWVGNDNNTRMKGVTGGSLPAAMWRYIMRNAHQRLPSKSLPGVYTRL